MSVSSIAVTVRRVQAGTYNEFTVEQRAYDAVDLGGADRAETNIASDRVFAEFDNDIVEGWRVWRP